MPPQQPATGGQPLSPEQERLLQQFGGQVVEPTPLDAETQALLEQFGGEVVAAPAPGSLEAALAGLPDPEPVGGPGDETVAPTGVSGATRTARFLTPMMGAITGGAKGALMGAAAGAPVGGVGAGPGAFIGGVSGGIVGAGLGELAQTGFERLFPPAGADTEARAGLVERLEREMSAGMYGEAGSPVVGAFLRRLPSGINRLYQPFGTDIEPFAREAMELLTEQTADGRVIRVLPGQVSTSRLADVSQNVAEQSVFGGRAIERATQAGQRVGTQRVQQVLTDLGQAFGTGPTGRVVRRTHGVLERRFSQAADVLWEDFYTKGGEIPVQTAQIDRVIAEFQGLPIGRVTPNAGMRAAERLERVLSGAEDVTSKLRASGFLPDDPKEAAKVIELAGGTPGEAAPRARALQELISQLGITQRALRRQMVTDAAKRQPHRIVTLLRDAALEDMDQALRAAAPDAQVAYTRARAFTREGRQRLNNELVSDLLGVIDTQPERVIDVLLKKNNGSQINLVRTAVDDRAFRFIQTRALREIIEPTAATGEVDWKHLLTRLGEGEGGLGANTTAALFPGGQALEIQRVARLMQQVQRRQGLGTGRMAIQLAQGGAVLGLVTGAGITVATGDPTALGAAAGTAGVVFMGPAVLARILTNPQALRWLTVGLEASTIVGRGIRGAGRGARQVFDSPLAARAAGNLLSFMLTPEPTAEEPEGIAPGTTLRVDPSRLGEITGQPGVRTGARVSLGQP